MKLYIATITTLLFIVALFYSVDKQIFFPAPTDVIIANQEEGEQQQKREDWFRQMHQTADGVDWKAIEYQNAIQRYERRLSAAVSRSDCGLETIVPGQFRGSWNERGAINQTGSVYEVDYDAEKDEIWLLSAGGSIWKSRSTWHRLGGRESGFDF